MTNYEFYKDEFIKINMLRGCNVTKERCEFKKRVVFKTESCKADMCFECDEKFLAWLDEEYVKEEKWIKPGDNIPVDTLVLCSLDSQKWYKRYYAGSINGVLYTFQFGDTSSTTRCVAPWDYMKLAEED